MATVEDETVHWFSRELELSQGRERWVVVYTQASLQRAQATLQRQVSKAQATWEQKCWHLGNRRFACEADAHAAAERELKEKPGWLDLHIDLVAQEAFRNACWIVGANVLEPTVLSDQQLIATYKGQGVPSAAFADL